ncbi:MAG: SMP-30/gluconolactonase/LRE family protein [Sedimentisphaerales bacterium]|nr:SMP-30/gluconolactonase/LRE family protein [Sedimentisphaerales bacterium]
MIFRAAFLLVFILGIIGSAGADDLSVDFTDLAKLAKAWRTSTGNPNWDPNWDVSIPPDSVINEKDLEILCESWLNPLITGLISPGATLQSVYYENNIGFEGATWDPSSDKLFFTRRTSPWRILRLDSPGNVTVWLNNSPQTNGMLISLEGRLLACDESPMQVSSRSIGISGPGDTIILADSSDGFTNKPNDLCQLANGNIYFTTPTWTGGVPPSAQGVWLLEPDGTVTRVNNTLNQPNGIITSLDETKLYVSEGSTTPANQRWVVFNINSDGSLGAPTQFFKPTSPPDTSNVPDGMTIDQFGNLYFTGLGGVWIVSPQGQQLDFISVYAPFNICFGGTDGKTLYITAKSRVWSLQMQVKGGELDSW